MDARLNTMVDLLFAHHRVEGWWPATSAYEVMVGAILTQNTAWVNVTRAMEALGENIDPHFIQDVALDRLKTLIRPAGFHNQKAQYLKALTAWFSRYDFDVDRVRQEPMAAIRQELLEVKGIGPETADSILLYALDYPSFVVDAYTMRLCARYPIDAGDKYMAVKTYFEQHFENNASLYKDIHALIVTHAQVYCRKKPICEGCPLVATCEFHRSRG